MTKLQELEVIIKKAVPNITELKFGRIIKLKKTVEPITKPRLWIISGEEAGHFKLTGNNDSFGAWINESHIEEVIGRTIRLADVLLTLERMFDDGNISKVLYWDVWWKKMIEVMASWDFEHNNLHKQSEEIINCLHKLLT